MGSLTQRGQGLTQGYPEEIITYKKRVRALSPRKFPWATPHLMGRASDKKPTGPKNCLSECFLLVGEVPFIAWSDMNWDQLWSVVQKFLSDEASYWLAPCLLTEGSLLSLFCLGVEYMAGVVVSQRGCGGHARPGVCMWQRPWQNSRGMKIRAWETWWWPCWKALVLMWESAFATLGLAMSVRLLQHSSGQNHTQKPQLRNSSHVKKWEPLTRLISIGICGS